MAFDGFMRSFGLDTLVEDSLPRIPTEVIETGRAFAEGVNAGAAALPALPVEYRVLGVPFEPWTLSDSMASTYINSWAMSENAPAELVSFVLRKQLDRNGLTDLWHWDENAPEVDAFWDDMRDVEVGAFNEAFHGMIEFAWGVEAPQASNNWVVSGARSADGAPIVANDPHLVQMAPSVWYVAEAKGGDMHVAGGMLAGTPYPVTGHNETVAWGLTNTMADYIDLAVLERVGERGYILAGEEKQLEEQVFSIPVRGAKSHTQTVYTTEIGPVITELDGTHLIAVRWHITELDDETGVLWHEIMGAKTVHDAIEAAKRPSLLSQNLVLGDTEGNIAWQIFGAIPKRRGFTGRVPYPASDPNYGWDGWLTDLPGELNPERGYISTANSKPDHPLADDISTAYLPAYRKHRIDARIEAEPLHTSESIGDIQMEWLDAHAQERVPQLLAGLDTTQSLCGRLLKEWTFTSTPDSVGAAVWAVFQEELMGVALRERLGEEGFQLYLASAVAGRTVIDANLEAFVPSRDAAVRQALSATCDRLKRRLGPDPASWQWGTLHPLKIQHPFGSQSALLRSWNMPEVPYGGSSHTINQAAFSFTERHEKPPGLPRFASLHPFQMLPKPLSSIQVGSRAIPSIHTIRRCMRSIWLDSGSRCGFPMPMCGLMRCTPSRWHPRRNRDRTGAVLA